MRSPTVASNYHPKYLRSPVTLDVGSLSKSSIREDFGSFLGQ